MRRYKISEESWEKVKDKLPCQPGYQVKGTDNRLFLNAVVFVANCGIPLRDLPERFGNWNTVYVRFRSWAKSGVWQVIFKDLADRDVKTLLIDSIAIRVHQHGAGALKKEEGKQSDQAIGRSRGGLTTKLHLSTDEKGRIKEMVLTGGQTADVKMSLELLMSVAKPGKLIADKAYDADWLLLYPDSEGVKAVTPPRTNRPQKRRLITKLTNKCD